MRHDTLLHIATVQTVKKDGNEFRMLNIRVCLFLRSKTAPKRTLSLH